MKRTINRNELPQFKYYNQISPTEMTNLSDKIFDIYQELAEFNKHTDLSKLNNKQHIDKLQLKKIIMEINDLDINKVIDIVIKDEHIKAKYHQMFNEPMKGIERVIKINRKIFCQLYDISDPFINFKTDVLNLSDVFKLIDVLGYLKNIINLVSCIYSNPLDFVYRRVAKMKSYEYRAIVKAEGDPDGKLEALFYGQQLDKTYDIPIYSKLVLVDYDSLNDAINRIDSFNSIQAYNFIEPGINYIINIITKNNKPSNKIINIYLDVDGIELKYFNNGKATTFSLKYNETLPCLEYCYLYGTCSQCQPSCNIYDIISSKCIIGQKCLAALIMMCQSQFNISNRPKRPSSYTSGNKPSNKNTNRTPVDPDLIVIPDDISISTINIGSAGEFSITRTITSAPKRPHVRSGHYRHYKNGKVVYIDRSVIHKDQYQCPVTATYIQQ